MRIFASCALINAVTEITVVYGEYPAVLNVVEKRPVLAVFRSVEIPLQGVSVFVACAVVACDKGVADERIALGLELDNKISALLSPASNSPCLAVGLRKS